MVVASKPAVAGLGSLVFLPNGQYLAANAIKGPTKSTTYAQVTRFTVAGVLDTTFQSPSISFGNVPIATRSISPTWATRFAVARLNSDGSLDATFGANGTLTTSVGFGGASFAVLTRQDSKILSFGAVFVARNTSRTMVGLGIVRDLAK